MPKICKAWPSLAALVMKPVMKVSPAISGRRSAGCDRLTMNTSMMSAVAAATAAAPATAVAVVAPASLLNTMKPT